MTQQQITEAHKNIAEAMLILWDTTDETVREALLHLAGASTALRLWEETHARAQG
jgi:hypothetical protein